MDEKANQITVNKMKHRNGFPPNFIHSLDASHMMLTALHLWRLGIAFAAGGQIISFVDLLKAILSKGFI